MKGIDNSSVKLAEQSQSKRQVWRGANWMESLE
jgi:hypothetical protein